VLIIDDSIIASPAMPNPICHHQASNYLGAGYLNVAVRIDKLLVQYYVCTDVYGCEG